MPRMFFSRQMTKQEFEKELKKRQREMAAFVSQIRASSEKYSFESVFKPHNK